MHSGKRNHPWFALIPISLIIVGIFLLMFDFNLPANNQGNGNIINNEITNTVVDYNKITVEDLDKAVQIAVEKVEDAVIGVTSKAVTKLSGKEVEINYSMGSGVIYKREEIKDTSGKLVNYLYYVVTNRHVVTFDQQYDEYTRLNLYIYLGDLDLEVEANLVGYDVKVDIALLTFKTSKLINPVEFADSDKLEKGQMAIAIGNPDGYDYYGSATFGIISGPKRYLSTDTDGDDTVDFSAEYIQHDVAINPGNSGGGLFTLDGKLVGINTLKLVADKIENIGFAIPSNVVRTIVVDYLEKGIEIVRPKLGVMGYEIRALSSAQIESSTDIISIPDIYNGVQPYGIYVGDVSANSTIAATEITRHDIILSVNGIKATRTHVINSKLNSLVDGFKVGETVTIEYYDRSSNSIKTCQVVLKK